MKSGHYDKSQWDKKLLFYFISTVWLLYHKYDLYIFYDVEKDFYKTY